jgi:hypothetical protein
MIIAEERFIALFDTLPVMTISESEYKPQYDFGTHEDLLRYLDQKAKEGGKVYPLVWLETPTKLTGRNRKRGKFKFILATLTNSEMSNRQRLEVTVKPTLVPLYDNIVKALSQSGFTLIRNRDDESYELHYNYGVKEKNQGDTVNKATDIWDVLKFSCELELTNCKQKKINY